MENIENIRICSVCGVKQLNGCYYWSNGIPAKSADLAGLVCQMVKNSPDLSIRAKHASCINKDREVTGGDTWLKRREFINAVEYDVKRILDK